MLHDLYESTLALSAPYGCQDHIYSKRNHTIPGCHSINILHLFDLTSRRHRSHDSKKCNKCPSTVLCRSSISYKVVPAFICYMTYTNLPWPYLLLSNKLLGQGYVKERLKSSLRKFYGRYGDLSKQYEVSLSRMLHDILDDDHIQ